MSHLAKIRDMSHTQKCFRFSAWRCSATWTRPRVRRGPRMYVRPCLRVCACGTSLNVAGNSIVAEQEQDSSAGCVGSINITVLSTPSAPTKPQHRQRCHISHTARRHLCRVCALCMQRINFVLGQAIEDGRSSGGSITFHSAYNHSQSPYTVHYDDARPTKHAKRAY